MKRLAVILAALASILLIFVILFGSMTMVMNDETFINNEFTELETAKAMNMNNSDLVRATMQLIRYMQGNASSIDVDVTVNGEKVPMFTLDQEHSHMADVRTLFLTIRQYRDLSVIVLLILYLFAVVLGFKTALHTLSKGYLYGAFVCALLFGFIGMWAALDFSSFWTMFHEALFWNDDWLFNPTDSRMINMLPEQMFAAIIGRIGMIAGGILLALAAAAIAALVLLKRKHARELLQKQRRKERLAREKAGLPPLEEEEAPDKPQKPKLTREEKAKLRRAEQAKKQRLAEREKKRKRAEKARKAQAPSEEEAVRAHKPAPKKAKRPAGDGQPAPALKARMKRPAAQAPDAETVFSAPAAEAALEAAAPDEAALLEAPVDQAPARIPKKRPVHKGAPLEKTKKRKKNEPFELDIGDEDPQQEP